MTTTNKHETIATASTHTPAPWALETVRTSSGICHKIGPFPWRPEEHNHACIYVDYPSHDGSSPVDQELLANARLIAAAPELLETLIAAEQAFGDDCEDGGFCTITVKMRQAIAKATGKGLPA